MNTSAAARTSESGRYQAWLLLIACVGATLVVSIARQREMWLDEYHTWLLASMPLDTLWTFISGDVHPPVYFLLMNLWHRLFGDDAIALRAPSFLSYVFSVGVFGSLLQRAGGERITRIAASCMFAFSPAIVFYGTEVRMYALLVLCATGVLWFWMMLVRSPHQDTVVSRRYLTGLIACAVCLVLTHYTGVFFLVGVGSAWFLRCLVRGATWRSFTFFVVVTGIAVGAWGPTLLSQRARKAEVSRIQNAAAEATSPDSLQPTRSLQVGSGSRWQSGRDWGVAVARSMASIAGVFPATSGIASVALGLPFVVLTFGVLVAVWERDDVAVSMLLVILASIAGTLVVSASRRYLLVVTPAFILLAWRGLEALYRRSPAIAYVAMLAGMIGLAGTIRTAFVRTAGAHPLAALTTVLTADASSQVPVILTSNYAEIPLRYHLRHRQQAPVLVGFPVGIDQWWGSQSFKGWATVPVSRDSTQRWVENLRFDTGWLIEYETDFQDPWRYLRRSLEQKYMVSETSTPDIRGSGWRIFRLTRTSRVLR